MLTATSYAWRRLFVIAGACLALVGPAPAQDAAEDVELATELAVIQRLVDRGRYEKAQREIEEILADFEDDGDPVPAGVYDPLAVVLEARGDYAGAIEVLGKRLALEPQGAAAGHALRRRADVRMRLGDLNAAKVDYEASLEAHPLATGPIVGLAELAEIRGDRKAAELLYRRAIELYNDRAKRELGFDHRSVDALIGAGRAAEGLGRTAGAHLGKAEGDGQMFMQAHRAYEKAQRKDEKAFLAFLRAGHLFLNNHSEAQARSFFRDVLKHNRSHPDAQSGLAAAYQPQFSRQKAAATHAQRALDVNPKCAAALLVQARLATTAENYEQAIARCDAVLAVNPNHRAARALRAACLHVLGRTEEFERASAAYARRHVGDAGVPHAVAAALESQRRFAEAAAWEQRAIELDPYHWSAWVNRGMNLLRTGDEEAGKKALEEGFRNYKYDVHAFNMLKLLRKLEGFVTRESAHFRMRFDPTEDEIMGPYCVELLERGWTTLKAHYGGFEPDGPILFEMFPQQADFAVRTLGLPGLGALGACFGKVVTIDSPKAMQRSDGQRGRQPAFNWAATAWHEYAHVVTLQLSKGRVPRWFTEGLSEFEEFEDRPEWQRPLDEKLYGLWKAGRLTTITKFNNDFMSGDIGFAYFYAGWICRFLKETRGRPAIIDMLKAYGAGKRTPQVLLDVLGWTPAQFDAAFHAFYGQYVADWKLPGWYGREQRAALLAERHARPDDAALLVTLARAYWQARNPADAEINAGRAIRLDDKQGEAHFILGEIARAKRRNEAATRRYKLAFERGFDDYHMRLRLAQIADDEGDDAAVLEHLEAAHRYFPRARGAGSPARRLASLYAQAGLVDDARDMTEHAVALLPEDLQGRERLLAQFVTRGDRAKVLKYCEEINNVDPFRFEHHLTWSTALREGGDARRAVREGEIAVLIAESIEDTAMAIGQHQPEMEVATGRAWAVRGLAHLAANEIDGAEEALDEAKQRAPDEAETKALVEAFAKAKQAPGDDEKKEDDEEKPSDGDK